MIKENHAYVLTDGNRFVCLNFSQSDYTLSSDVYSCYGTTKKELTNIKREMLKNGWGIKKFKIKKITHRISVY